VQAKLEELKKSLLNGVEVITTYDRARSLTARFQTSAFNASEESCRRTGVRRCFSLALAFIAGKLLSLCQWEILDRLYYHQRQGVTTNIDVFGGESRIQSAPWSTLAIV